MVDKVDVNFLNSPLSYAPLNISDIDLAIQLLVNKIRTMVNVIGKNLESTHFYLEAL